MKNAINPNFQQMDECDLYDSFTTEYLQSIEEGLDIEGYKELFDAVKKLPRSEVKTKLGDILFDIVTNAKMREDYPYNEPSDLVGIRALCQPYAYATTTDGDLRKKVYGAWMGRICGCMLGKTVECIHSSELWPFLKETNNFPMHRYIYRSDLSAEILAKYQYDFASREYADQINGMPADDDTNYTTMAQLLIEKYGKDFTPYDVANLWSMVQSKNAYCTAERVAFHNFSNGYEPPQTAIYKNPYREWIGAQIRGDYFGYINPGNPSQASEMAWRDASISHVKNGIYGEMLVAAMISIAAVCDNIEDVILGALAYIPSTSRLYEAILNLYAGYKNGMTKEEAFEKIHEEYNESTTHCWCHTISNALIVVTSLLYGDGNFAESICMAVETGYDTDCNGATVGSIVGMMKGIENIPEYWTKPFSDKLNTTIFGVGTVSIRECADKTMKHIELCQ